ncbi:thioredoxin reductase [Gracilibacillus halophilus YIM-C55.5]|uniref:Ferredoxin--NADP reductase n=1 Tax=Gracilibacillus halophilus YIM-C55.5 TaxID=1308866 RepID=N4WRJ7_9BACI|nr:NAD(P)/FAD-dependent oxidoreductase [Gracilibacillus halophilus]ENH95836.1 thioredoxin reductase [Gracilibacillus halophilus YIM-C55.5]
MRDNDCYDVTIIGGGPAGLYASFYSGMRELKTKIIEYQPQLGGKIHVYPEKMIWDVGGITPIPGEQLMKQLTEQALTFHPTVVLNEKVQSITQHDDGTFTLSTNSEQTHRSKTVIVAVGSGILKPNKLEIEGAERFEITNLHYTVTSLQRFKDKTVLISGGGNSAIDWAIELEPIAKQVYLVYRNKALKGHEAQISQVMNRSTICYLETSITRLLANQYHDAIEQIELTHVESGDVSYVTIDEVIISHGYERDATLLHDSTLDIALKDHFISGNAHSESSVEGLYAAGDVLTYDGKLHLIAGAFQDAANAVNQAKQFIDPEANKRGMVSSHNAIFKERNQELIKQMVR